MLSKNISSNLQILQKLHVSNISILQNVSNIKLIDGNSSGIAHYLMGIAGMIVCALGFLANTLSIAVLSRRSMRQTITNQYLLALAMSDLLVLVFTVLTNLKDTRLSTDKNELQSLTWSDLPFVPLVYPYAHALCITFQVSSVWLTVAFTTDRYFMVCHPFVSERCCNSYISRFAVVIIFIFAFIYCVPRFFEHKIFMQDLESPASLIALDLNQTKESIESINISVFHSNLQETFSHDIKSISMNDLLTHHRPIDLTISKNLSDLELLKDLPKVLIWYDISEFGNSDGFRKDYHLVSWVVLVVCLPLGSIAIMNIFLIIEVSRSRRRGQEINAIERRRQDTNVMLISVIIIFFICQVPAGVSHIMWGIIKNRQFHFATFILNEIGNFLVILNSAINIVPYYLFGKKFRKEFLRMFCRKFVSREYIRRLSFNLDLHHRLPPLPHELRSRQRQQQSFPLLNTQYSVNHNDLSMTAVTKITTTKTDEFEKCANGGH